MKCSKCGRPCKGTRSWKLRLCALCDNKMPVIKTSFDYRYTSIKVDFVRAFFEFPGMEFTALEFSERQAVDPHDVYQGLKVFQSMGFVEAVGRTHSTSSHPSTLWRRLARISFYQV